MGFNGKPFTTDDFSLPAVDKKVLKYLYKKYKKAEKFEYYSGKYKFISNYRNKKYELIEKYKNDNLMFNKYIKLSAKYYGHVYKEKLKNKYGGVAWACLDRYNSILIRHNEMNNKSYVSLNDAGYYYMYKLCREDLAYWSQYILSIIINIFAIVLSVAAIIVTLMTN